jgi:hypothetical protein
LPIEKLAGQLFSLSVGNRPSAILEGSGKGQCYAFPECPAFHVTPKHILDCDGFERRRENLVLRNSSNAPLPTLPVRQGSAPIFENRLLGRKLPVKSVPGSSSGVICQEGCWGGATRSRQPTGIHPLVSIFAKVCEVDSRFCGNDLRVERHPAPNHITTRLGHVTL